MLKLLVKVENEYMKTREKGKFHKDVTTLGGGEILDINVEEKEYKYYYFNEETMEEELRIREEEELTFIYSIKKENVDKIVLFLEELSEVMSFSYSIGEMDLGDL